jgi:hypothetical protein
MDYGSIYEFVQGCHELQVQKTHGTAWTASDYVHLLFHK